MLDELAKVTEEYQKKWQQLVTKRKNKEFFDGLRPTSVAWKTVDLADFSKRLAELRDTCDQIHLGWVNERWIGTLHLKDERLPQGLAVIKLMQRRPGSTDAVGLDHLDFFISSDEDVKVLLADEADLKWTEERNGDHCKWISIWFEGTEAKLRRDTVLQVCADEMLECQEELLA